MFKALFLASVFVTLVVNIIFLLATKEKPPDLSASILDSVQQIDAISASSKRRLFLRSNDFYDYSLANTNGVGPPALSVQNSSRMQPRVVVKQTTNNLPRLKINSLTTNLPHAETPDRVSKETATITQTIKQEELVSSFWNYGNYHGAERIPDDKHKNLRSQQFGSTWPPTKTNFKRSGSPRSTDGDKLDTPVESVETNLLKEANTNDKSKSTAKKEVDNLRSDEIYEGQRARLSPGSESNVHHGHYQLIVDKAQQTAINLSNAPGAFVTQGLDTHERDGTLSLSAGSNERQASMSNSLRSLNIKVKSSRNHVFVSVDNIVIYESKTKSGTGFGGGGGGGSLGIRQPIARQQLAASPMPIVTDDADSTEGRGIHVIVLNEYYGYVMSKRIFDTYSPNQDKELCFFINMVRDGRILIFAVKDEGSFKMPMSSSARELLQKLGSRHIMRLRWRDMWALVVRKSTQSETNLLLGESSKLRLNELAERMNLAEGLTKSSRFSDWAPPVILETRVELLEWKQVTKGEDYASADNDGMAHECRWNSGNKDEDNRRLEFCGRIEGYGRICDCSFPAPISFNPPKIANSQLDQVPIVVMASNRPYYLYRMLRSLLSVDGVNASMVTVFIDGYYDEPLMVSRLFDLRAVQQKPLAQRSARISHHYKSSLTKAFELFPQAQFAIIFEEDLDIAQDTLVYFNQTLELLKHDPSLYCVSAWNDQGYEHSASDNRLLYRIETMPGLGWMLSRRLYKDELEPYWPSADQPHDWDMWIRTPAIRKDRECIIPDISRTFHFGSTGTNINSYFQRQYFSKHAFNLMPIKGNFAHIDQMYKDAYEKLVEKLVREAKVIDGPGLNSTEFLCSLSIRKDKDGPYDGSQSISASQWQTAGKKEEIIVYHVIYIEMIDKHDYGNWLKLAKCWHIWDLDARGQHNSMWRLFLNGQRILVIGAPASPYARFKPIELDPFKLT